ncbi:MAG: hypothetical protein RBG1_1C00001G0936 [candidate division Zixibacteria bacterium RBG-1]|nr:MAG: hypothetical protein RBG1_1C00001G0936 [candidate division Zixibacteria bacterium RBG-1]
MAYYVTRENLREKISEWKRIIQPYNTHQMKLEPKNSALLVIDMQKFFLNPESLTFTEGGLAIVENIRDLIRAYRSHSLPVIYTCHVHKSAQMDGGMMSWWWKGICLEGTEESKIFEEIKPLPEEKIVFKHRYSAFYNTDLEIVLRCLGVKDLVITGIMTNMCCDSTARDAYYRDYRVFFLLDATGSVNEDLHVATLKNTAFGFAYVTDTEEILAAVHKNKAEKVKKESVLR